MPSLAGPRRALPCPATPRRAFPSTIMSQPLYAPSDVPTRPPGAPTSPPRPPDGAGYTPTPSPPSSPPCASPLQATLLDSSSLSIPPVDWASMPEVSVDEHGHPGPRQPHIGPTREPLRGSLRPQPDQNQGPPEHHLRLRVFPADARHHPAPPRRRHRVHAMLRTRRPAVRTRRSPRQ